MHDHIPTLVKAYVFLTIASHYTFRCDVGARVCSCYLIDTTKSSRYVSRHHCKQAKGDLVSMETEQEWGFIVTKVQNKTLLGYEWWIGLDREDRKWQWLSNHSLTYDKWQPGQPDNTTDASHVILTSNALNGSKWGFANIQDGRSKGKICEQKIDSTQECQPNQVRWCDPPLQTTTPFIASDATDIPTQTILSTTANNVIVKLSTEILSTVSEGNDKPSTLILILPTRSVSKEKDQHSTLILTLVILVGVLVFVCISVIIRQWIRANRASNRRRKRCSRNPVYSQPDTTESELVSLSATPTNVHQLNDVQEEAGYAMPVNVQYVNRPDKHTDHGTVQEEAGYAMPVNVHDVNRPDKHTDHGTVQEEAGYAMPVDVHDVNRPDKHTDHGTVQEEAGYAMPVDVQYVNRPGKHTEEASYALVNIVNAGCHNNPSTEQCLSKSINDIKSQQSDGILPSPNVLYAVVDKSKKSVRKKNN